MKNQEINRIIESLECVLKRPKMYFGSDEDTVSAASYLYGVRHAVSVMFNAQSSIISMWHQAIAERGHEVSPRGVAETLRCKGYKNDQIVKELIEIEIELWKIFVTTLKNKCAE